MTHREPPCSCGLQPDPAEPLGFIYCNYSLAPGGCTDGWTAVIHQHGGFSGAGVAKAVFHSGTFRHLKCILLFHQSTLQRQWVLRVFASRLAPRPAVGCPNPRCHFEGMELPAVPGLCVLTPPVSLEILEMKDEIYAYVMGLVGAQRVVPRVIMCRALLCEEGNISRQMQGSSVACLDQFHTVISPLSCFILR